MAWRGAVLSLKHQLFVEAARRLGAADRRIMFGHVAPHALGPGMAVLVTVLAINLLGDGVRDALDPTTID